MKRAEVEFITFDAKDVIATSGFEIKTGAFYLFSGANDNIPKNLSVTMYNSLDDAKAGQNPVGSWSYYQNGVFTPPVGLDRSAKIFFYDSQNNNKYTEAEYTTFIDKDANADPLKRPDVWGAVLQWMDTYFMVQQ